MSLWKQDKINSLETITSNVIYLEAYRLNEVEKRRNRKFGIEISHIPIASYEFELRSLNTQIGYTKSRIIIINARHCLLLCRG